MPFKNRVDPWGNLHAKTTRGILLGNRGILHNGAQEIVAQWRNKAWVTCTLQFKGRKREIFGPGTYSELFFLDEATAFSAGHRPCGECRKERYKEFKTAWIAANAVDGSDVPIQDIDAQLHSERVLSGGSEARFEAPISELPSGTFIELDGLPFLLWGNQRLRWSFAGYQERVRCSPDMAVRVLTPRSVVQAFRHGLVPEVHPSASDAT